MSYFVAHVKWAYYLFQEFDDYRDADDAVYELNGKELLGERWVWCHFFFTLQFDVFFFRCKIELLTDFFIVNVHFVQLYGWMCVPNAMIIIVYIILYDDFDVCITLAVLY